MCNQNTVFCRLLCSTLTLMRWVTAGHEIESEIGDNTDLELL